MFNNKSLLKNKAIFFIGTVIILNSYGCLKSSSSGPYSSQADSQNGKNSLISSLNYSGPISAISSNNLRSLILKVTNNSSNPFKGTFSITGLLPNLTLGSGGTCGINSFILSSAKSCFLNLNYVAPTVSTPTEINIPVTYGDNSDGMRSRTSQTINFTVYPKYYSIPYNISNHNSLASNNVRDVAYSWSEFIIYAATDLGLSISKDEGKTFSTVTTANGLGHNYVNRVYSIGSMVYAATKSGLSISSNSGKSFTNYLPGQDVRGVFVSSDEETIYAAVGNQLYISSNSKTNVNFSTIHTPGTLINGLYADNNYLFVATSDGLQISNIPVVGSFTQYLAGISINNVYVSGSYVAAATDSGIYAADVPIVAPFVFSVIPHSNGNINLGVQISSMYNKLISITNSGIDEYTYGGGVWNYQRTLTSGLGSNEVNSIYYDGYNIFAATTGGLSISTGNAFDNFSAIKGLGSSSVRSVQVSNGTIYAATYSGVSGAGVSISKDGGNTFTKYSTANGLGHNHVNHLVVSGESLYAATDNGVSVMTNSGLAFNNYTSGLGNNKVNHLQIAGGILYAATDGGLSLANLTSSPLSFTSNYTTSNGFLSNTVNCVVVTNSNNPKIFVGMPEGLFVKTAVDTPPNTFNGVASIPGGNNITSLFAEGTNVYAGSITGELYVSTDGGDNFVQHVANFGGSQIKNIHIVGNNWYISTAGGLYKSTDGGVTFSTPFTTANGLGDNQVNGVYVNGAYEYVATEHGLSVLW